MVAGFSVQGRILAGGEEKDAPPPPPLATMEAAAVVSELSVSMSSYFPATALNPPLCAS